MSMHEALPGRFPQGIPLMGNNKPEQVSLVPGDGQRL